MNSTTPIIQHDTKLMQQLAEIQLENSLLREQIEELEVYNHKLSSIINNAPIGVLLCNSTGVIIHANQATEVIFECTTNELLNSKFKRLFPLKKRHSLTNDFLQNLCDTPEPSEHILCTKNWQHIHSQLFIHSLTIEQQTHFLIFVRDISKEVRLNREKEMFIQHLENALKEVNTLGELIPICSYCKKIRDDQGYWHQVENYLQKHADITFSHSICQSCSRQLFPDLEDDDNQPWLLEKEQFKTND